MSARHLAAALDRAAAAFEAGDAVSAAAHLAEATRDVAAAERAGARLGRAELETLRALHARCEGAAARARATLEQALDAAGAARRACAAYRRP